MQFESFEKIPRFNRDIVVTEKIDGTNAQIVVPEDPQAPLLFGSRNRYITPKDDNFGFARWATENQDTLRILGPGRHFGEWWGSGIGRKYDLKERRFSLFNVKRWGFLSDLRNNPPKHGLTEEHILKLAQLVHVVPVLWTGAMEFLDIHRIMEHLKKYGSQAAPGFMNPEGIVLYHTQASYLFKMTFEDGPKGEING